MKRKHILLLKAFFVLWVVIVYVVLFRTPSTSHDDPKHQKSQGIANQLDRLELELGEQSRVYRSLLDKLRNIQKERQIQLENQQNLGPPTFSISEIRENSASNLDEGPILPVLLIACNREAAVRRSLDLLLKYRPNQKRFPIIVSQDCGHRATKEAILSYNEKVILIQQPDLSEIEVPLKERKFRGYFLISRHYKWALNQIFQELKHKAVIIVEDDLDIAPDFFEYFSATYPILKNDESLWCVSAWNDNGKSNLVDVKNGSSLLYRTDFFPGLGWMMTKNIWDEIGPKWPRSYWDDWMRGPDQRKGRACIRPELSRTRTFGKKGVSNGLFYEKHLKYIHLNDKYVPFTNKDLSYLDKKSYDVLFDKEIQNSKVVKLSDVKEGKLEQGIVYRLIYHTKDTFKKMTKALGLMDDFKAGIPRTGYRGVVSFFLNGVRIHLAPNNNWNGYDPSWS